MGETVAARDNSSFNGGVLHGISQDWREIDVFISIDRIGAIGGAALVLVVNALLLNEPLLWIVFASVVALVIALTAAKSALEKDSLLLALGLLTAGNWLCALTVSIALPFLWPVMVLTVLMPMVLITPYLQREHLMYVLLAGAILVGVVSSAGLLNDDGGAIPDIDDAFELFLVVGSTMAQLIPISLIVWQNNNFHRQNLAQVVGLNQELLQYQEKLAASGRRVVEAADSERRRIERNLHDGAQQRLVALGVRLRLLESQSGDVPKVNDEVERLVEELDAAVEEVRELAHGIYPPLLQSRGLNDALRSVARRSSVPVQVEIGEVGRYEESVETAIYFAALEALTNAAKHAPDAEVEMSLTDEGSQVRLVVSDNGPGFIVSDEIESQGTHNMGDRVRAVRGEFSITSDLGDGTTVTAVVPTATR